MTRKRQAGSLVVAAILILTAGSVQAADPETLQIEGSTTVGPIALAFAEAFMKERPGVSITVKQTGSGDGAAALVDGRCDIATMSRFMKEKEFKAAVARTPMAVLPVAHVVAMDGVCIIVHASNPVAALTTEQIRKVYKGEVTNWNQLGGVDAPVVAITRDTSSGTFETFHKLVMNKEKMIDKVETVGSNPQAYQRVKSTPGAMAYVGLGFVKEGVKAVKVDGVLPTARAIASGTYPVARPLFMVTNGYPKLGSLAHAFVTFHLSEKGHDIVDEKGFVPVTEY